MLNNTQLGIISGGEVKPNKTTNMPTLQGPTIWSPVYMKFPDTSEEKTIHTKGKDHEGI
jgi:hypothetical protein